MSRNQLTKIRSVKTLYSSGPDNHDMDELSDIGMNDDENDPEFMIELGEFDTVNNTIVDAASVDLTLEQELSEDERTIHQH
jgi:hypothetical protein